MKAKEEKGLFPPSVFSASDAGFPDCGLSVV